MKEERFSSGTPSKNKISNFGDVSPLYPNFVYHTLSLSQFEEKQKSREDIYIRGLSNYYIFWHFESVYNCSKGIIYFYVTTWSMLFFAVLLRICCCHIFFSASYVILLTIVLLIPLKYHTGNRSHRLLQYNIITTKTYRLISSVVWGEEV